MGKPDIKNQVRELISKGETGKAIDVLLEFARTIENPEIEEDTLIVQANLKQLKREQIQGTITHEDYSTRHNQINLNTLTILDSAEDAQENTKSKSRKTKTQPTAFHKKIRKAKELIGEAEIEEAIDFTLELTQAAGDSENEAFAIRTQANFKQLKRSQIQGIISNEEYYSQFNRIVQDLLSLLNKFEQFLENNDTPPIQQKATDFENIAQQTYSKSAGLEDLLGDLSNEKNLKQEPNIGEDSNGDEEQDLTLDDLLEELPKTEIEEEEPTEDIFQKPIEFAFETRPVQNIVRQEGLATANAFDQYEKFISFEHKSTKGNEFFHDLLEALKDYNNDYRELTRVLDSRTSKYKFLKIVDYLGSAIESNFYDEDPVDWEEKRKLNRKELIEFRANSNQLLPELLSANVLHALRYLKEPENHLPILSDNHRKLIAENVLGVDYEEEQFAQNVANYFDDFGFEIVNPQNLPALYSALLFDSKVKPLWDRPQSGDNEEDNPPDDAIHISNYPKHDADIPKGEDKLNIMPDVRAFARLMASKDLKPPLSIGVFGNWGSGKSFFMEKMEEVVKRLTDRAKDDIPGTDHYVKDIVQIKFNAWYYIDANLWASLVTHIFEQLSKAVGNKTEEEKREIFARRRLAEALKHQNDILKEIQAAEKEKERIDEEIKRPETNQRRTTELQRAQKVQESIITQANREINRIRENQKMLQDRITIYEKRRGEHTGSADAKALMVLFEELKTIEEQITGNPGDIPDKLLDRRKAILSEIRELELKDENIKGQLYEDLATTYHLIEEAEVAKREALKNVEEVEKEIASIETMRLKRQDEIHKTALNFVLDQIRGDDEFQGFVKEVVTKFDVAIGKGEKDEKPKDGDILEEIKKMGTEEIQGILNEYDSTRHRWLSVFNFLKNLDWLSWLLLAIIMLIPFAMAELVKFLELNIDEWITRISAIFMTVMAALGKLSVPAKKAMKVIDEGITYVEKAKSKLGEFEKQKNARIEVLKQQYEKLSEQQKEAQQRLQKAKEEVAKVRQEILEISKGKRLASFIERRLGSNDYQQHLGLISLIRQDFNKLSKYLKQKIDEVKEDRKIDRIILYIDDLDRCPPEKVIEVLQAIHLILAFDLFVVVVGVDVRWVSRSLMKRYPEMLRAFQANGDDSAKTPEFAKSLKGNATPYDYLEKIFQIPFKIKSLEDDDKEDYLEKLLSKEVVEDGELESDRKENESSEDGLETKEGSDLDSEEDTEQLTDTNDKDIVAIQDLDLEENDTEGENDLGHEGTEGSLEDPTPEDDTDGEEEGGEEEEEEDTEGQNTEGEAAENLEEVVLNMEPVRIGQSEYDFLRALTPILGDSPRSIKRFVNVYRLIKSNDNWKKENQQPHYREILVLLSIVTTAPTLSQDFFEVLLEESNTQMDFSDFVKKLKQYTAFGKIATSPDQHERLKEELQSLIDFFTKLPDEEDKAQLIKAAGQLEIKRFQEFVPLVSRFSFRTLE